MIDDWSFWMVNSDGWFSWSFGVAYLTSMSMLTRPWVFVSHPSACPASHAVASHLSFYARPCCSLSYKIRLWLTIHVTSCLIYSHWTQNKLMTNDPHERLTDCFTFTESWQYQFMGTIIQSQSQWSVSQKIIKALWGKTQLQWKRMLLISKFNLYNIY